MADEQTKHGPRFFVFLLGIIAIWSGLFWGMMKPDFGAMGLLLVGVGAIAAIGAIHPAFREGSK